MGNGVKGAVVKCAIEAAWQKWESDPNLSDHTTPAQIANLLDFEIDILPV